MEIILKSEVPHTDNSHKRRKSGNWKFRSKTNCPLLLSGEIGSPKNHDVCKRVELPTPNKIKIYTGF
jgi:hypothetical protein